MNDSRPDDICDRLNGEIATGTSPIDPLREGIKWCDVCSAWLDTDSRPDECCDGLSGEIGTETSPIDPCLDELGID